MKPSPELAAMASMPQRILLLVALGLWVAARVVPVTDLLNSPDFSGVRLLSPDSYYHLRHAEAVAEHFPQLSRYDVGTHYPRGERGFNQGLHDLFLSLALMTCGPLWFGVLMGVLVLLLVYLMVAAAASEWAALGAVALLAAYPGHLRVYASMGNCDHHSTEVLLALAVVGGFGLGLQGGRLAWLSGVAPALFFFTWFGAPLHLGLAGGALIVAYASKPEEFEFVKPFLASFWLTLLPLWLLAPSYRVNPRGLLLAGLGSLGLVAMLALTRKIRKWGILVGLGLVGLFSFTVTGRRLFYPRELTIAEHQPLDPQSLWFAFGPLLLLYLIACLIHFYQAFKGGRDFFETLLTSYGLALVLLWLKTLDFAYYAAPFVVMTLALEAARTRWKTPAAALLTGVLLAFPLLGWGVERPWLVSQVTEAELVPLDRGLDQALRYLREQTPAPEVTTTSLVAPFQDFDYGSGTYGILCDWNLGHLVAAVGWRTPVFSQTFNGELAQKLLAPEEAELMEYLESKTQGEERFGYLLLTAHDLSTRFAGRVQEAGFELGTYRDQTAQLRMGESILEIPTYGPKYHQVFLNRLYFDPSTPAEHFRPVFDSTQHQVVADFIQRRGTELDVFRTALNLDPSLLPAGQTAVAIANGILFQPMDLPAVRVWEIVKGARLVGHLEEAAELRLEGHPYRRMLASGPVEVTVANPGTYHLGPPLKEGGETAGARLIEVSEEAVHGGLEVKF